MKKKLIGALALSAFILLSACTPSSTEPSSVGSNPSSSSASSNIPDPPPKKLTGGSLIDIKMENYAMWPLGLYKNLLIFGSSKPHTSPDGEYLDTEDDFFHSFDLQTKQMKKFGEILHWKSGSGDFLVMDDRYLYSADLAGDPQLFQFCGFSLDGAPQKIIDKSTAVYVPFQFFAQYNSDVMILRSFDASPGDEEICDYYLKKYNIHTGAFETIVSYTYNLTAQEGKSISSVFCNNDKIYAISSQNIEEYDIDGNILKSYSAKPAFVKAARSSDGIWRMSVYDGYFIFSTTNGNTLIFKQKNGGLEEVTTVDQFIPELSISNPHKTPDYIFLTASYDNKLKIFDIKSETIHTFEFKMDEACKYLEKLVVDDEGNMIVLLSSSKTYDDNATMKYFYFSAEEIKEQIK